MTQGILPLDKLDVAAEKQKGVRLKLVTHINSLSKSKQRAKGEQTKFNSV